MPNQRFSPRLFRQSPVRCTRVHNRLATLRTGNARNAKRRLTARARQGFKALLFASREQDDAKAAEIELWVDDVAETYNVLNVYAPIFRRWAQLMHRRANHHLEDALIAATAVVRDMIVATRNIDDFKPFGVQLINPF